MQFRSFSEFLNFCKFLKAKKEASDINKKNEKSSDSESLRGISGLLDLNNLADEELSDMFPDSINRKSWFCISDFYSLLKKYDIVLYDEQV